MRKKIMLFLVLTYILDFNLLLTGFYRNAVCLVLNYSTLKLKFCEGISIISNTICK